MPDYEKLGLFYLGRTVDSDKKAKADYLLYDSRDLVTHAVCVGMTGSGKTGLCIDLLEEAAIDGVPALVIDPKGDLGNLLLTFPNLSASDFRPWIDEDEARRNGKSPDEMGRGAGRPVEEGPRELGPGRRSHQAAARGGRLRDLHAGLAVGPAALDHQVVRRALGRLHRRSGSDARARRDDGHESSGAAGHRRGPDQEPRAHPALHAHRRHVAQGPGSRSRRADPVDPEAARRAHRRDGPRRVLPGRQALRAGDVDQQPAGRARLQRVDGRRAARRPAPALHDGGEAARVDPLDRAPERRRAHVLRVAAAEPGARLDAPAAGHDQPPRAGLHGRDRGLPAAGGEPGEQGADADAAQAGARVRRRHGAGHAEPGGPGLQGACPTPARGSSAGCRPSATRRACWTASRARCPPPGARSIAARIGRSSAGSASASSCCTTCTRIIRRCSKAGGR